MNLKLLGLAALIGLSSCMNYQKAVYFNNIKEKEAIEPDVDPVIQKNDLLSIMVTSLNPEATAVFNTPNQSVIASTSGNGTSSVTTGYLVDNQGQIVFPILGNITVAGLTQKQLTDTLASILAAKKLLTDPIVSVRFLNFKVTVLGEVNRPGVIPSPSGKLSILEALGQAGDLTLFAKRDNVLLVRVENGKKITRRINLNGSDFVFSSPYYYLKTNDILYVEPNKAKIATTSNFRQSLPIVFSALSFAVIVIDRLTR
jgi:polysaccharide biosynthesis/export protein